MTAIHNGISDQAVLQIRNLSKSFGQVKVLTDISLDLKPGIILGLAGENGAGKSTLANCISGRLKHDAGNLRLNGTCCVIPQEFTLIPTLTVYENIFLGRELTRAGFLRRKEMIRKSEEILDGLHQKRINVRSLAGSLGVAEKQMVEIAKAFLYDSNLLIMDEPTTVLNRIETAILFDVMRDFKARGGAIIYVSHKLEEVRTICDEIAVLRDGVLVSRDKANEITALEIAQKMVGRKLARTFPPKIKLKPDAEVVLEAKNLSSGKAVQNVSFSLHKGEILGLAGLAGAGRTELAETLCGLRRRTNGEILLFGQQVHYRTPSGAMKAGLSYLSEDRQGTAILRNSTLTDNVTLASLANYCKYGWILNGKCRSAAEKYVERFKIKTDSLQTLLRNLSGGNQQKVSIAKGLDTDPRIFIFDEPTRGVDVGARGEIYDFIHELAESGVSCLLISSDLEEVIGNCDRVLVMRTGILAGEVSGDHVTEEEIMYHATGVK